MNTATEPCNNNEPEVNIGHCHSSFAEPGFGKFIIVYDLETRDLHFIGNLKSNLIRLLNLNENPSVEQILQSIAIGDTELDRMKIKHSKMPYKDKVENGVVVGGACAYFDGINIYVDSFSGSYGMITESALRITLEPAQKELFFGSYIEQGNHMFSEEGLENLRFAITESQ